MRLSSYTGTPYCVILLWMSLSLTIFCCCRMEVNSRETCFEGKVVFRYKILWIYPRFLWKLEGKEFSKQACSKRNAKCLTQLEENTGILFSFTAARRIYNLKSDLLILSKSLFFNKQFAQSIPNYFNPRPYVFSLVCSYCYFKFHFVFQRLLFRSVKSSSYNICIRYKTPTGMCDVIIINLRSR